METEWNYEKTQGDAYQGDSYHCSGCKSMTEWVAPCPKYGGIYVCDCYTIMDHICLVIEYECVSTKINTR